MGLMIGEERIGDKAPFRRLRIGRLPAPPVLLDHLEARCEHRPHQDRQECEDELRRLLFGLAHDRDGGALVPNPVRYHVGKHASCKLLVPGAPALA